MADAELFCLGGPVREMGVSGSLGLETGFLVAGAVDILYNPFVVRVVLGLVAAGLTDEGS